MKIQFISNPFLNTTREHEGWKLIGEIFELDDIKNEEVNDGSYRLASVNDIIFGEVVYVQSKKPFIAQLLSVINTDEFSYGDDSSMLLACVLELRNKKISYISTSKILKPTIVTNLRDMIGLRSICNSKQIVHVDKKGVIVRDNSKPDGINENGYRLTTQGGVYECFEKLRAEGFPVMYHNKIEKLITNFSDLEKFCNTLNCKLLLNNTEDSMMWQIVDINDVKFDFRQFLNERGHEFYNINV